MAAMERVSLESEGSSPEDANYRGHGVDAVTAKEP